jgi:Acetyltransferase (GNAT) domain
LDISEISPQDFDCLLDNQIYYFLQLKRLYELQAEILLRCEGRLIKNDLIYQQMLFASLDGLFVRISNFHDRLHKFFNLIKAHHLHRFKRNNKRDLAVNPREVLTGDFREKGVDRRTADIFTKEIQRNFDKQYDKLFPGVRERNEGCPNHSDFDQIAEKLRKIFDPIKNHRDTVVAHWDKKGEPATISELKIALDHLEYLLGAFYLVSKLGTYIFELGGIAARVEQTAVDLAELILGEFRIRAATPSEMAEIYEMGFDAWGDGYPKDQYNLTCANSLKYAKGIWYVLENKFGKPVSSLITYPLPALEQIPCAGIGSLATIPTLRKKGHAQKIVWEVRRLLQDRDKIRVFYLWSDIESKFYRSLNFVALPERLQRRPGSILMVHCSKEHLDMICNDPGFEPPDYF